MRNLLILNGLHSIMSWIIVSGTSTLSSALISDAVMSTGGYTFTSLGVIPNGFSQEVVLVFAFSTQSLGVGGSIRVRIHISGVQNRISVGRCAWLFIQIILRCWNLPRGFGMLRIHLWRRTVLGSMVGTSSLGKIPDFLAFWFDLRCFILRHWCGFIDIFFNFFNYKCALWNKYYKSK